MKKEESKLCEILYQYDYCNKKIKDDFLCDPYPLLLTKHCQQL